MYFKKPEKQVFQSTVGNSRKQGLCDAKYMSKIKPKYDNSRKSKLKVQRIYQILY